MQKLSTDLKYGLNRHKNGREFFEKKNSKTVNVYSYYITSTFFFSVFLKNYSDIKKITNY